MRATSECDHDDQAMRNCAGYSHVNDWVVKRSISLLDCRQFSIDWYVKNIK